MLQRLREQASGDRLRISLQFGSSAGSHHITAEPSGTGAEVDHMVGATDGVLIMFNHDQRVALGLQLGQRVEQDLIVARMQADGRLIEDVGDAAQIRSELCGEADALCFTAGQRRCGAVECEITEADFVQEAQPAADFSDDVARNRRFAAAERHIGEFARQFRHRQCRQFGDRTFAVTHRQRRRVQPFAGARRAGLVDFQPVQPGIEHMLFSAGFFAFLVPIHFFQRQPGAEAGRAPAVFGVV